MKVLTVKLRTNRHNCSVVIIIAPHCTRLLFTQVGMSESNAFVFSLLHNTFDEPIRLDVLMDVLFCFLHLYINQYLHLLMGS